MMQSKQKFREKISIIYLLAAITLLLTGCQGNDTSEALTAINARLDTIQAEIVNIEGQLEFILAQDPILEGFDHTIVIGSGVALTLESAEAPIIFSIKQFLSYPSLDDFDFDWSENEEVNNNSSIKFAWIPTATPNEWRFFYANDMFTVDTSIPTSWRSFLILMPISSPDANSSVSTPSQATIEYGPSETITTSSSFEADSFMSGSIENLLEAESNLPNETRVLFLVSDHIQGQDVYKLVAIEDTTGGPDEDDDSITAEYCSRCSSWRCEWRCWWHGYPTP